MQSLDVYKYLNTLVRSGSDHLSHYREPPKNLNRTFKGDKFDIHVFTGHAECLQILKDANFIQPKMADAIAEIFGSLGLQPQFIENFLRENPIGMDGSAHHAAKQSFLAQYRDTQRDLSPILPAIAERAFTDFIDGKKSHILTDLVEPYVDSVVEAILSKNHSLHISRDNWRGNSSCIFEYVHPIRKLKQKDAQAFSFARQLKSGLESRGEEGVEAIPILLTYVLQGRDPLMGALCGYMHSCIAMQVDERNSNIEAIDARELFSRTSPVNYTGRIATWSGTVGNTHVQSGDHVVLMLSWANHDAGGSAKNSLAFGAGSHVCAGQALALAIADAWISELRSRHQRIRWHDINPDQLIPAVFRQYRAQSDD